MAEAPHNPYTVEVRKPLTSKQRMEMFIRHGGICCICSHPIDGVRQMWDEHINPLWLSGDNKAENRAPAHAKCAREKTASEAPQRAHARAVAERHFGARRPKSVMPGSRLSKWKRRMDGTVERRT